MLLQRWLPKVPAVLVMVSLSGYGVSLVGVLPKGVPAAHDPGRPRVRPRRFSPGALGIAVVSLADTIPAASAFAARAGQEINGNHDMSGIGVANLGPASSRTSRSARAGRGHSGTLSTSAIGK